ncbi:glycosyltransferase family 2 protein [Paenibacillus arenilitoris]|uniref:Glycosyltransferase family 2 protein n=1 Tax=Paenibacillus arenilitoris TaxID=2772299 RepID=A0A927CQ79_9BACL|nr:glycosyltransferase family 2 protein [Paenibacillus arenilitoris]MBD2871527.1 glycosyltransferase family 2 protein [Paenibacillus arenilitoris]
MRWRSLRKFPRKNYKNYLKGYAAGYRAGRLIGTASYHQLFNGTSIIIPTYNQFRYLKDCIESIRRHTPQSYELIIIDNGSTDATPAYLKSQAGRLRYKLFQENLGFAGGVNQGLMMAKGTSIVILNNDTIVTTNWLSNLLMCLKSDPTIGLVGPVTNNLSNDQKIRVSYKNKSEMQRFARKYNRTDPWRWRRTKVIMGYCLLLSREVFERVGYLDERFLKGTCEDVDYYLRIRLLGLDLVIAEDTFIHHYGSVTMRSFQDAAILNNSFFREKWGELEQIARLEAVMDSPRTQINRKSTDFYPSHIVVKGTETNLYWVENGERYIVQGADGFTCDAVKLPQLELWNWPIGGVISVEALRLKVSELSSPSSIKTEGCLVQTQGGEIYQIKHGSLHRITTQHAFRSWGFECRYMHQITQVDKNQFLEGFPIIAPPIIKADNI